MAKLKLPKIDLKELKKDMVENQKQRRKFIQWYAKQVAECKA